VGFLAGSDLFPRGVHTRIAVARHPCVSWAFLFRYMICRSYLFQLRQLRMVRSSMTLEAAKMLVHTFVCSHLDYCNSLLYGISDSLLAKIQTVQNAAARVVTETWKFDHITPVLHQLRVHWLLVRQRITFKLAMITFKCLRGLAPSYLADVCIPVSSVVGRWQLWSADSRTLVVQCTRTSLRSVGETLLCQAQPHGTASPSNCGLHHCLLGRLRKKLKNHLFGC